MSELLLYNHPVSSYAQKVRIALREKGIPFTAQTPEGLGTGKKLEDLGSANPRIEVPALVDGQFKIFDSKVILQYLEDKYPEKPLLPKDAQARAEARMIEEVCDTQYEGVNWGFGEVRMMERATGELADKLIAQVESQTKDLWSWLESRLGQKEFFNGASFGFADICVAPYVNRSISYGFALPDGSALQKWFERTKAIPSVAETYAEMQAGMSGMAALKDAFKAGKGNRREYRDHRLEFLVRSGGLPIVLKGIEENTIRFSWPGPI